MLDDRWSLKNPLAPCTFHVATFMYVCSCWVVCCRFCRSRGVFVNSCLANVCMSCNETGRPRKACVWLFSREILRCPRFGCMSPQTKTQVVLYH